MTKSHVYSLCDKAILCDRCGLPEAPYHTEYHPGIQHGFEGPDFAEKVAAFLADIDTENIS
jgi:hypothetical protein